MEDVNNLSVVNYKDGKERQREEKAEGRQVNMGKRFFYAG